jgi:hypothetical protein
LLAVGRWWRSNDGRIHNRAALEQQAPFFEKCADLGENLLS